MKDKSKSTSRRKFVRKVALGSAFLSSAPQIIARPTRQNIFMEKRPFFHEKYTANDHINLAIIGAGIQGSHDTNTALRVAGIKLVAACDLYDGRLSRAKEQWGDEIKVTRDYREILGNKEIDAVIIATPDHWHKKIAIESMKAGKAVYCEKPMVHDFSEGHEFIQAQKETGAICQIGSQGMSSLGNEKARQLYEHGAIGELVMLDMYNDRYSSEGAWQYPIPPDANEKTMDFDTFLGTAPKVPFEPKRFFRWRNYQDYGTGVAGDLFVHAFSTLHYIIGSEGPEKAMSTGGLRYWKDGRDVPDVTLTFYDYPKTKNHAAFNASFRVNFVAGSGGGYGFKLVGTEGAMEVGQNSVKLVRTKMNMKPGGYSLIAYTEENQRKIKTWYDNKYKDERSENLNIGETNYQAPKDYKGAHYDHFYRFFQTIRGKSDIIENPTFGMRAAGAALLANESYFTNKPVRWNPTEMKLI